MAAQPAAGQQNASLYVGDLTPDVTEAMLFDLFKAVGPVLSIRVCRDAVTRRSLGYAYVNFQNPVDAERALETLNYHTLKGAPLRIMWSHRDPSLRKAGAGNVFIKNLHKSIDNQTLYDTFSQFGNILSCKVATDSMSGESRGYGFVHFESEESAKAAIEKVNGMLLKSLQVYVGPFHRRAVRQKDASTTFTNLYIKDMKEGVTEEVLKAHFATFGTISSTCLKADKKGRPFAFVSFETHEEATKAVEESHDKYIETLCPGEDSKLYCQRAQKKSERMEEMRKKMSQLRARKMHEYSGSNLYVKNLDDTIDKDGLIAAFEKFGEITSAKVVYDDATPPVSKGFGFVCFKDAEAANKAISEMNGHMLGAKPLYVNVAQRKEVRQATLEVQYAARYSRMAGGGPQGAPPVAQPMGGYPMYGSPPGGFPGYPGAAPAYPYGPAGPGAMPRAGMMGAPKWAQQGMPGMGPFPPQGAPPMQMPGGPQVMQMRPAQQGQQPARRPMPGQGMPGSRPMQGGKGGPRPGMPPQMGGGPGQFRQPRSKPDAPAVPAAAPVPAADIPLTPSQLANMSPEQQKNALGERLFAAISAIQPEYAAKITGMLLEMDVTETLNLLESPDVLNSKIGEALAVLQAHEGEPKA
uniref:Polyadenylate-binding protein n=1 Tax=Eutreptiella gymnastica TaxID=73025 RepID=A0A7S1IQE0_9EUGL